MLALIKLMLPALAPSWRFFDAVGPSPRIEYSLASGEWREWPPRPALLTPAAMIGRLFWNPERNESLFLTSCAERLVEAPNAHSRDEIAARLAAAPDAATPLRWRIALIHRDGARLVKQIAYASPA